MLRSSFNRRLFTGVMFVNLFVYLLTGLSLYQIRLQYEKLSILHVTSAYPALWHTEAAIVLTLLLLFTLVSFLLLRNVINQRTNELLAKESLRNSEEKYHDIFVNAPIGIFQRNLEGTYTYFNPVLVEQFECRTAEEFTEKYSDVTKRWADPEKLREFNELLLKNRVVRDYHVKTELYDGTIKWFLLFASLDNSNSFFNGFTMDITERKQAEDELDRYRLHLQELVTERTTELGLAVAAAESANRAKSEFLDNMNHEMRTPLNAVIGMTSMLLETELNGLQRRYAQTINDSSDNLLFLINNLLDISKIEEGCLELESHPFDLSEMVTKIIGMFTYSTAQKGLQLEVRIDPDVPLKLRGDAGRIGQVLINLLGNAVKFTDTGFVAFQIQKDAENGLQTILRFKVIDSGIGIPVEKQEMIFRPFTQVDGSTTRKYGGTGLGLSISRKLINLMGGEIGVESSEGKGATFWCTTTLERHTDVETVEQPIPAGSRHVDVPSRSCKRLLLAEDDPINQQVAISYLERLGYTFDIVENGRTALQALTDRDYDLVLIDIMMPEIGGIEATAIIRDPASTVRDHGIPVIALTAKATMADREACLAAGMNDFLTKPLRQDMLSTVLSRWLPPLIRDDEIQTTTSANLQTAFTDDREVIALFVAKAPGYVAALQQSLIESDATGVRHHAHRLAGAAAAIGANSIADLAAEIEDLGLRNEIKKAEQKLQQFSGEFRVLMDLLTLRE